MNRFRITIFGNYYKEFLLIGVGTSYFTVDLIKKLVYNDYRTNVRHAKGW